MDVYMSNYDGWESIAMIRNYEAINFFDATYIYFVSGGNEDIIMQEAKEFQIDAFVAKPLTEQKVEKVILERAKMINFDAKKLSWG